MYAKLTFLLKLTFLFIVYNRAPNLSPCSIEKPQSPGTLLLEALQGWQEDNETGATDPYNSWFATVLFSHILQNNPRAKSIALAITFGDEENGRLFFTQVRFMLI